MVNTSAATIDGSACPVDIFAGYDSDFAITGDNSTIAATSGGEVASAVIDDVKGAQVSVIVDPNYIGAKVQSTLAGVRGIVNCGTPPYFAFNLDGATTLSSGTCHWVIVQ